MSIRLYHVALMVPPESREAANMIVRDTTGNPADINSFTVELSQGWWACTLPISPENFERLPQIQSAIGGHYEVLRTFDPRDEMLTFDEALELHGFHRVYHGDENE
jgi:hypothetical protein